MTAPAIGRSLATLADGPILDGRNRYLACLMAKVEPRFKIFRGAKVVQFILSANLPSRQLSTTRRAIAADR